MVSVAEVFSGWIGFNMLGMEEVILKNYQMLCTKCGCATAEQDQGGFALIWI